MKQLIKKIREAPAYEESVEYLIPYMKKQNFGKGVEIFKKGDPAEKFFLILKGSVLIPVVNKIIEKGSVFGEVGMFLTNSVRTAGAECIEDCELYSINKDKVMELYFQEPKFGFFITRLLANYATNNVDTQ